MRYAATMLIRGLPLVAGILPVLGVTVAYWLGASNEVLPSCMPFLDGCTSISAAGRYMPGSLPFRAAMMPQAAILAVLWYFAANWLESLAPATRARTAVLAAGLVGALALIVYVTFLGTKAPLYEFMRQFGIYFYFLGTAVAQLTLATALFRHAGRAGALPLRRLARIMLWLCGLPFALGVLNLVLKTVLEDSNFAENRIEWISALLMQGYFVVLYVAWRQTAMSVEVTTG